MAKLAGLSYPASLNETEKYNYVGDLAIHIQRLATSVAQSVYWQATNRTAPQRCETSNVTVCASAVKYNCSHSCVVEITVLLGVWKGTKSIKSCAQSSFSEETQEENQGPTDNIMKMVVCASVYQ